MSDNNKKVATRSIITAAVNNTIAASKTASTQSVTTANKQTNNTATNSPKAAVGPTTTTDTSQNKADTDTKIRSETLTIKEENNVLSLREKLNDDTLTPEEKKSILQELDTAGALSVEEKKTLEDMKKRESKENEPGGNKGKGPGIINTHNADETDEDDEKFKIQEGDIIDWMMKEVILASADYVGNKACKLAGHAICGFAGGSWNCAVSTKDWVCEKAKKIYKNMTEEKQYPTDATGVACRNVSQMSNQYANIALKALNKSIKPWENHNLWRDDNTQQKFVQQLKDGQLMDVVLLPPLRTKDEINSGEQIKEGQVISEDFRKELWSVIASVDKVDGVEQDKIDNIKAVLAEEGDVNVKNGKLKGEYNKLSDDEKKKYSDALAAALKENVGNVDEYAAKKIKEQIDVQHEYGQNKTDKYYDAVANAHTKEGLQFLQDTFFAKPQNGEYCESIQQMQEAVGKIVATGKSEEEAWKSCSDMLRIQSDIAASEYLFSAEYAAVMITQKYLTDKKYKPNADELRAEIDKYSKEGRMIHKFGVAGGNIDDIREDLDKAKSNQNDDLMNGRYAEKDSSPKKNKALDRIAEVRDFIKQEDGDLLTSGRSLREEAADQNSPVAGLKEIDELNKINVVAEEWNKKKMRQKQSYTTGVSSLGGYISQNKGGRDS